MIEMPQTCFNVSVEISLVGRAMDMAMAGINTNLAIGFIVYLKQALNASKQLWKMMKMPSYKSI